MPLRDPPATLADVTFDDVVVRDSFNGLRIGEPGVDYTTYDAPEDVRVHESSFTGNAEYAAINEAEDPIDARLNYWGAPTGPTADGNPLAGTVETGQAVRGPADVTPWCATEDCTQGTFPYEALSGPAP